MSRVDITLDDLPPCPHCMGPVLLLARIPHGLRRADGVVIAGTRGVSLCPYCDRGDPAAQGVLACFAVNEAVTDESVSTVAALVEEWVERVAERRGVDSDDIDAGTWDDYQRWRAGEM